MDRYKVITLCGSVRFKVYHIEAIKALTLQKYIVLPLGTYGQDEGEWKLTLYELRDIHYQRIDMSDAIYVIDPNYYVGKSTREEIDYAKKHGKKVFYMSQHFRHEIKDEEWGDQLLEFQPSMSNSIYNKSQFDQITIELTSMCLNNCIFCSSFRDGHSCYEYLDTNKVIEVINDAISLGVKTICFSGGEPFLYDQFEKVLDYLNRDEYKDIEIIIYTSGIWGSRAGIVKNIIVYGYSISKIIFDLPSMNLNTFNELTGRPDFDDGIVEAIQNIDFALNTLGKDKVELNCVPNALNICEIGSIVNFAKKLDIPINFLALVYQGRAAQLEIKDKLKLANNQFYILRDVLYNYQKSYPKIRIGTPLKLKESNCICNFSRRLTVRPNGDVTFCEAIKELSEYRTSKNINDSSLKDIIESEEFIDIKNRIQCIKCNHTNCPIQEIYYENNNATN